MDIEITTQPIFWLPLTPRQVAVLDKLSKAHYDATCKAASRPGEGGFIHGWHVMSEYVDSLCKATWREMDLCLKIMENSDWLPQDEQEIVSELRKSFWGAMNLATNQYKDWTADYRD